MNHIEGLTEDDAEMFCRFGAGDGMVEEQKLVAVCIKQSAFHPCLTIGSFCESMTDQIDGLVVGW